MEISFRTKEESNNQQREAFLKLKPGQRFEKFLEMMDAFGMFSLNEEMQKRRKEKEERNFVIEIKL